MLSGELWVICGLIFVAAFFAVHGLYGLAFRARRERRLIKRRLALTERLATPSDVSPPLRRDRGFGFLAALPVVNGLEKLVVQSGVTITPTACFAILAGLSFFFYVLLGFWLGFGLAELAVAIIAGGATLNLYLLWARRRRIARFTEQLPMRSTSSCAAFAPVIRIASRSDSSRVKCPIRSEPSSPYWRTRSRSGWSKK
jgi:Flp pilus assembly protein TadB